MTQKMTWRRTNHYLDNFNHRDGKSENCGIEVRTLCNEIKEYDREYVQCNHTKYLKYSDEHYIRYGTFHQSKEQFNHHPNVLNSSFINRYNLSNFNLIHLTDIFYKFIKFFEFLSITKFFTNHFIKSSNRKSSAIGFLLLILLLLSQFTNAQQSTCPNAKQINDLKPLNVNLNCDCTQTADGHKASGWEIMCYSIENVHNNESPANAEKPTTLPTVDRTENANRAEMVEEVTNDNLSLSNFGDERVESDNFFAERLSANEGNLEYGDEMSLYRSVPIAFTIKYISNQLVSIECYENVPNFKPAMFQDFKIDEIDAFKIMNCALPDIPFSLLFHRANPTIEVPNIRSLRLETLHTQSIDLNQFKKLFVNLESLEVLSIDNYELDTNGKGLRMKRQIPFSRTNGNNMMQMVGNNFNSRAIGGGQQNITNSKQFFVNKMLRSTALNNALQNAMNNNAAINNQMLTNTASQPAYNRFKSTPFNFATPPSASSSSGSYSLMNGNRHFESNRLMNVRAIHNQNKPTSFDQMLTTMSTNDDHSSSMIFRHFDAINNPTTSSPSQSPPISRFNNFNAFMRISRLPNHSTSPINLGSNSFSSSSFQPSTFPTNSPSLSFNNYNKFTTPLPPTSSSIPPTSSPSSASLSFSSASSTTTTTTTSTPSSTTSTTTTTSIPPSSSSTVSSTTVRTFNLANVNNSDHSLLTSDSRLISNHLPNNLPVLSTTNRPLTYSLNLLMTNSSSTASNATNDSFIGLENHNQPNRMKTPLLTNMLNKRNNTGRSNQSGNISGGNSMGREMNARKLNLNFRDYFPNLKVLKIRSLLTNYDKDNAYFVKEMLSDLNALETFELTKNIIYTLPNQMLSSLVKLRYLYLNHNQIQQLERDALYNLKMLETLELENNDLKEINEDTFRSLNNLKQIKLKRNKFQQLPERLFSRNRNLVEIDLSQNRELFSLPDHLLRNLNQLRNLSVFDCQLNQISNNPQFFFANAPQLRNIYMRNNRLKYLNIRNLFAYNGGLIKLDLSYNDISYISPEIFSINSSSLVELNLYANNLVDVPTNLFANLKNLKFLNLGFNNLTEVDVSIFFSLKNLEELDLSKNLLTTINPKRYALPFGIGTNLRTINLAHNKLTSFANEFGVINWSLYLMLSDLNLSNNLLQGDLMIPVFYSPKMKLDLRQNQFNSILIDEIELNERSIIELKSTSKDANKSIKSQVSVYLSHNPINCDCRLFGFINYTRTVNAKYSNLFEKVTFDTEYLECQQPEKLSRTLIEQLNDADLSCSINDTKVCPTVCNCKYVSKYRQVEMDCQQRSLTKPPNKVLIMSNYDELTLLDSDQKLANKQIDLISLKFSHNRIKNLDTFNSLLFKNNTIRRRSAPIMLELYLDNNTIDTIGENFLNLAINSSAANQPSDLSSTNGNNNNKYRKQNNHLQNVHLKTLSITNNQLEYVPVDFLNRLALLTSESKQLPQFKLYLSANPFNCTPVQQASTKKVIAGEQNEKVANDECYVKEMKNWLTQNYNLLGDLGDVKCYDTLNGNNSKQLIQYADDQLCPREMDDKSATLILLYTCIGLTTLLFILTVFYFRNRQTILAFVYIHVHPIFFLCGFNEEDLDEEKLYDAFVSYSSQDRDVVMQLIEHLEQPSKQTNNSLNYLQSRNGLPTFHEANADKIVPDLMNITNNSATSTSANGLKVATSLKANNSNLSPAANEQTMNYGMNTLNSSTLQNTANEDQGDYFKLCIHERDWLPGQLISWNIINSVRNSRRTILVLSKSFIESIWFQIEFHTAYYQMLEDKMDRLIVIVRGELPERDQLDKDLAFLLSTKTYLVWGEKYFWEKLRYSLPHKRSFKEKNKAIKPLINGNNLKLHDFGTYSTTPTSLNSRNTLYSNSKLSSKAKYMEECINNAISDYYKLDKKTTSTELSETNNRNGYDLEKKMKANIKPQGDDKYSGQVNPSFENETET